MPEEPLPYRVYQVCCVVVLCIYYLDSLFLCFPSFSYEWSAVEAARGGIAGGDPVVNTATSPSLQAAPEEAGAEGITGKAGSRLRRGLWRQLQALSAHFCLRFFSTWWQQRSIKEAAARRALVSEICSRGSVGEKNSYRGKKKKKEPKLSKSLKMQKYCISETSETSAPPIR